MHNLPKAIFVVGNSRSGTTMMSRILGGSEIVFSFGELHFYGMIYDPRKEAGRILKREEAIALFSRLLCIQRQGFFADCQSVSQYSSEAETALQKVKSSFTYEEIYYTFLLHETQKNGKSIPCEQTPRNLFFLNRLLALPMDVRVVNMIRDPRDVLNSQKNKWKRRYLGAAGIPLKEAIRAWFNYHPIAVAILWRSAIREYGKYISEKRVKAVHFEAFLENPERHMAEICHFLEVPYNPSMLEIPQIGSSDGCDSEEKGVNKARINPWKYAGRLNKTEIYLCEKFCHYEMQKSGYQVSGTRPNIVALGYYYAVFPLQMGIALLFNFKRVKNLIMMIRIYFTKGVRGP